jgi:hypothetical protein
VSHDVGHAYTDSPHHYRPLDCCTGKLCHSWVFQRSRSISDVSTIGLWNVQHKRMSLARFEVFTAVTMKNGVFWDVTSCGSCKNRRFGGT